MFSPVVPISKVYQHWGWARTSRSWPGLPWVAGSELLKPLPAASQRVHQQGASLRSQAGHETQELQ